MACSCTFTAAGCDGGEIHCTTRVYNDGYCPCRCGCVPMECPGCPNCDWPEDHGMFVEDEQ